MIVTCNPIVLYIFCYADVIANENCITQFTCYVEYNLLYCLPSRLNSEDINNVSYVYKRDSCNKWL